MPAPTATGNRLRDAIRRARLSDVERSDVIVDLREAELARLQLLQDALGDLAEELPAGSDMFDFQIQTGVTPRLWVDMLAHVSMGRDKRTYRLVQETRYGRQLMFETTGLDEMASRVTDYVARRMLERERALAGDTLAGDSRAEETRKTSAPAPTPAAELATASAVAPRKFGWAGIVLAFIVGLIAGAAALFFGSLWYLSLIAG
ncbi:MAG: hypothetical protein H6883_09665 [Rhodobiaceae bacterium]|nr:hypothetical protein [Rhodobiaceae bacterium]MCC0056394.1 hypothetical protein [Rhodobiaceae bacterium]